MDQKCDITKTRSLTLLDTLRKVVMKIIINQLLLIIAKHSILKRNNFIKLPGGSTEILIKLMNMILENAKIYCKLVWILLQNLSKTYDRVNLSLIKKAMMHIRILTNCIEFIIDFFTYRKNVIYTKGGLMAYYNIKIGIDQGKVISLLL